MSRIIFFHASMYDSFYAPENEILDVMYASSYLESLGHETEIIDYSLVSYEPNSASFLAGQYNIAVFFGNNLNVFQKVSDELKQNPDISLYLAGNQMLKNLPKFSSSHSGYLCGFCEAAVEKILLGDIKSVLKPEASDHIAAFHSAIHEVKSAPAPNRERAVHHGLYYDPVMPGRTDIFGRNTALISFTRKAADLTKIQDTVFYRTIDSVAEEVDLLKMKYGMKSFCFQDAEFLADPVITEKLIVRLYKEFDIRFRIQLFQVSDHMRSILASHGCVFGI